MERFFGFSGRVGRGAWWLGQALNIFVIVLGLLLSASLAANGSGVSMLALIATLVLAAWINIAVTVQRYHDLDKSGAWFLMTFVPVIGALWVLVECGFIAGTSGANRYGPRPGHGGGSGFGADEVPDYADIDAKIARMKSEREAEARAIAISRTAPSRPATGSATGVTGRPAFGRRG